MDHLACPIDKYDPLELHVFEKEIEVVEGEEEVVEGVIICPKCSRWYPIRGKIASMLPDELREEKDDLPFMRKWKNKFPKEIVLEGKPFNLGKET